MSKILLKSALWSIGLFLFMNLVSYLLDPEQFMFNFKYDYKRPLSIMVGIFTVIGFWLFFMVVFSVRHYFVKRKQSRALLIDEVERSPSEKKAAVKRVLRNHRPSPRAYFLSSALAFSWLTPSMRQRKSGPAPAARPSGGNWHCTGWRFSCFRYSSSRLTTRRKNQNE